MQPQIVGVAELTEVSGEERVGIVRDDDRRSRLLSEPTLSKGFNNLLARLVPLLLQRVGHQRCNGLEASGCVNHQQELELQLSVHHGQLTNVNQDDRPCRRHS